MVFLDSGPLGMLSNPVATNTTVAVERWAEGLLEAGLLIVIPEIADYEVRRELLRLGRAIAVRRLDLLRSSPTFRFIPVTTEIWLLAAGLWAEARNAGRPTSDPHAPDADAILAASVRAQSKSGFDAIVATTNVGHLSRFVPAALWQDIQP